MLTNKINFYAERKIIEFVDMFSILKYKEPREGENLELKEELKREYRALYF